jgi:HrpA-like RNA helicase
MFVGEGEGSPRVFDHNQIDQDLQQYYIDCASSARDLGKISNWHKVWADVEGAGCSQCKELAMLASKAVDAPKTGQRVEMPAHLQPTTYPSFMEKSDKAEHRTKTSILQKCWELCPKLGSLADIFDLVGMVSPTRSRGSTCVNPLLLVAGHEEHAEEAQRLLFEYTQKVSRLMRSIGLQHETELFAGASVFHRGCSRKDSVEQSKITRKEMRRLRQHYREIFFGGFQAADRSKALQTDIEKKAAAWYFAAYDHHRSHLVPAKKESSKRMTYMSFAWIMDDELLRIMRKNLAMPTMKNSNGSFGQSTRDYFISRSMLQEWEDVGINSVCECLFPHLNDVAKFVFFRVLNHRKYAWSLLVVFVFNKWISKLNCFAIPEQNLLLLLFAFCFWEFCNDDVDDDKNGSSERERGLDTVEQRLARTDCIQEMVIEASNIFKGQGEDAIDYESPGRMLLRFLHRLSSLVKPNLVYGAIDGMDDFVDAVNIDANHSKPTVDASTIRAQLPTDVASFLRKTGLHGEIRQAVAGLMLTLNVVGMMATVEHPNGTHQPMFTNFICRRQCLKEIPDNDLTWVIDELESSASPEVHVSFSSKRSRCRAFQNLVVTITVSSEAAMRVFVRKCSYVRRLIKRLLKAKKLSLSSGGGLQSFSYASLKISEDLSIASLPVSKHRKLICEEVRKHQVVIIRAPTGSGKSIGVPKIILDDLVEESCFSPKRILCTQPRRIAATSLAAHVANLSNTRLGDKVGYQIGGSSSFHRNHTQLLYCTTGIALNIFLEDTVPWSVLIMDEIHTRTMLDDILMTVVKEHHLKVNANIKIILMSAAADCEQLANFFGGCPILDIPGTTPFPIQEKYLDTDQYLCRLPFTKKKLGQRDCWSVTTDQQPFISQREIAKFVVHLHRNHPELQDHPEQKIIVFLAGVPEIRRLGCELDDQLSDIDDKLDVAVEVKTVHGRMAVEQQQAALKDEQHVRPTRTIILATDVVESSITIPECKIVVNCCLHKRKRQKNTGGHGFVESPLALELITKDEALQRKGRTGRTCSGCVFHLILENEFKDLQDHPPPEMESASVAEVLLTIQEALPKLSSSHLKDTRHFLKELVPSPPSHGAIDDGYQRLLEVGAISLSAERHPYSIVDRIKLGKGEFRLTHLGRLMQNFLSDSDVVHLVFNGLRYGVLEEAEICAGILLRGSPFYDDAHLCPLEKLALIRNKERCNPNHNSDLLAKLGAFLAWRANNVARWGSKPKGRNTDSSFVTVDKSESDLIADYAWCWEHYFSLGKLLEIEEATFQIRQILSDLGLALPHPSEYSDRVSARRRKYVVRCMQIQRVFWENSSSWEHGLSDFGALHPMTEKLLLWILGATYGKNIVGVKSNIKAEKKVTFISRRASTYFYDQNQYNHDRRSRVGQKKQHALNVNSAEHLESFLRELMLSTDKIVSTENRQDATYSHEVTFSSFEHAALAAQMTPNNPKFPYTRCSFDVEAVLYRGCFGDGASLLMTNDTACDMSGLNSIVASKVIPSSNQKGSLTHIFIELSRLPSSEIHKAIYAATSSLFPTCKFAGKPENFDDNFVPSVADAVNVISNEFDKEFTFLASGQYLEGATGNSHEVKEIITQRQQAVLKIFQYFESRSAEQDRQIQQEVQTKVVVRWAMPQEKVGLVIGRGGANIKSFQKEFNVRAKVDGRNPIIECSGSREAIQKAKIYLEGKVGCDLYSE